MIHFNFILEDKDAEALFDCVQTVINQLHALKLEYLASTDHIQDINKQINYFKELKSKLTNYKVPSTHCSEFHGFFAHEENGIMVCTRCRKKV